MDYHFVPVTKLKPKLLNVISRVQDAGEEYVVTKNGKPAAVIIGFDEWESWMETIEILSDKNSADRIRRGIEYFKKGGKGLTIEEVFGDKK